MSKQDLYDTVQVAKAGATKVEVSTEGIGWAGFWIALAWVLVTAMGM